jgi:glycosyltransferase involved in cell wall biosynthesis
MTRFLFFTKTRWNEPPRLRHQLANLLTAAGHQVIFFEKPGLLGPVPQPTAACDGLVLAGHRELLHHRLRLLPALHHANRRVVARSIRRAMDTIGRRPDDVVVNFNYDYWFLGGVFPGQRVITVINDDFVNSGPFGYTGPARWAMSRTCAASDRVLTVSRALQRVLAPFCEAELFLPWADRPYEAPLADQERNILLFWGFIDRRMDFGVLARAAAALARHLPTIRIVLAGPQEDRVAAHVESLVAIGNVTRLPAAGLGQLPLDEVLAGIIPYRAGDPVSDAIMLPNKAMPLLARGVPLMIAGMPDFIEAPFVLRFDAGTAVDVVRQLQRRHGLIQPDIERFVDSNTVTARTRQFLRLVPGA